MNVAQIMEQRSAFSFEVFPPKTDVGITPILDQTVTPLTWLCPGTPVSCPEPCLS